MATPSGAELARPFLPTRDFDASKRFYEALGFEKLLDNANSVLSSLVRAKPSAAKGRR